MNRTYALIISNNSNYVLLDFIILSTKYYIYKCFIAKSRPTLEYLVNEIKYFENIEKEAGRWVYIHISVETCRKRGGEVGVYTYICINMYV